jgi:dolichol-phosphate mannosyltransferase
VPACNEEGNVVPLVDQLTRVLAAETHEIIFVDDGSSDGTLERVKEVRAANPAVHFVTFSRNFGHQNAIKAGIDFARGSCVIMIDGDLQHPPELMPLMLEKWREGYEVVNTIRKRNGSVSVFKRLTARIFYWLLNLVSEVHIDEGMADFRLLDRSVVDVLRELNESGLFYRGLVPWAGFRTIGIPYSPNSRHSGATKYSFSRMIKFAVSGLVSFSVLPLRVATVLGGMMAVSAFVVGIKAIYDYLFTNNVVPGWASTIVTVVLVGGIQLIMLGVIGEYIGRLFMESKRRPHYIVRDSSMERERSCG